VVFDGTPDQLTTDVARTIYGADGLKEAFSEAMTSTSIAPLAPPIINSASANPAS
jgi:phosphonate transport system ATP-binding protein